MHLDSTMLSRIQFATTVSFHIIFPTLNIGLAVFLAVFEGLWLKTKNPLYYQAIRFWGKVFALSFGMGVASGVVMAFEFGTNFGRFTSMVGSVLGPMLGYEVTSAFFLEAGFLGIMLFGWKRVSPKMHWFATCMVTIGTLISAFWILSANSWMQHPVGAHLVHGKMIVDNWFITIFNPMFIPRLAHMLIASLLTSSFVIAATSAYHLLKGRHASLAKKMLGIVLTAALALMAAQLVVGDTVGYDVHKYQPIKTAALEANWNSQRGAPLVLFGWPNEKLEKNDFEIAIPKGASLVNTHSLNGYLQGLKSVPASQRPPVPIVFITFRLMVGIGFVMLLLAMVGVVLHKRDKLFSNTLYLRALVAASPLGFLATLLGWITAESGRQPWAVYGVLKTVHSSSMVPREDVMSSLIMFICVYGFIFVGYLIYVLRMLSAGPVGEALEVPALDSKS